METPSQEYGQWHHLRPQCDPVDEAGRSLACWVDNWLAAWSGNRLDLLLAWYAEDCVYADPLRPEGLVGKAALAAHLGPLLERHPEWRFTRRANCKTDAGVDVEWKVVLPQTGRTHSHLGRIGRTRLILRDRLILQQDNLTDLSRIDSIDMCSSRPDAL